MPLAFRLGGGEEGTGALFFLSLSYIFLMRYQDCIYLINNFIFTLFGGGGVCVCVCG